MAVSTAARVARTLTACLLVLAAWPSFGTDLDWSESQATRDYYNRAASLKWRHFLGDWIDAAGRLQGDQPFATTRVEDRGADVAITLDVTSLIRDWLSGKASNQGVLLRAKGGSLKVGSREHADTNSRPVLVVTTTEGTQRVAPTQDTTLYSSTFRARGKREGLDVSSQRHALLAFDLSPIANREVVKAHLELTSLAQYGATTLEAYAVSTKVASAGESRAGLAAEFPNDEGLSEHPDVLHFEGFEPDTDWRTLWRNVNRHTHTVDPAAVGIPALSGHAIDATIPESSNTGLNLYWLFGTGDEPQPQSLYLRYYLYLTESFAGMGEGGKLPGIAGTYDVAGWGGRRSDGTNGWSARGLFDRTIPEGSPLAGRVPIGTYLYHADMKDFWGNHEIWDNNRLGLLETGRWYSIEQQITLNDVGSANGILRGWIDGRLAYENTSLRFRTVPELRIDRVWLNVYHGGTAPAPQDLGVYLDNIVIARDYIGPMASQ